MPHTIYFEGALSQNSEGDSAENPHSSEGNSVQIWLDSEGSSSSDISCTYIQCNLYKISGFTTIPSSTMAWIYVNAFCSSIWIPHSGCAITLQLVIYAMTSWSFQEIMFLQFILFAQQQKLQNQDWWEQLFFISLTIMVTSIHSCWPTWITCPSLQSIYFQQKFLANSLQMSMVLINRVQETCQFLMITLSFGIMVNSPKHSRHTLPAFQNAYSALVILNYSLL